MNLAKESLRTQALPCAPVRGNEPGYEAKFKKLLERSPHFFEIPGKCSVSRGVLKPQCRVISTVLLSVHVKVQKSDQVVQMEVLKR